MASTPSPGGGSETWPSSPSSSSGSQKAKRYDRQLRLWGDHGQVALERSRICVVNASATATEVLKALVLPGVGQFTIVDGKKVSGEDAGNNFFLHPEAIGQSRGAAATRLLLELNPEVRGSCVEVSPDVVLRDRPDFFRGFDLVVASELDEKLLASLSELLWAENVPLVVVRAHGLLAYLRIQVREHAVVESHPDNAITDLRLDRPFDALKAFMDGQDLAKMDKNAHSHVPYAVILYKYLEEWRKQHGSPKPGTYREKLAFKEMIRSGILTNEDGVPEEEENFEEAIRAVNTALATSSVPTHVKQIFDDPCCLNLTSDSTDFWIVARAVKEFIEDGSGQLPVVGNLPDMFSDSDRYVKLHNVYRDKAQQDAEEVHKRVRYHLESIGRPAESISENTVRTFCKDAANLRLVRNAGSISEEYSGKLSAEGSNGIDWGNLLEQDPDSEATYYLILRGVDRFCTEFSTCPGALEVEPDIGRLKTCVSKILNDYHVNSCTIKDDYIHEVCRYGGAELHAVAAFIGGCAAQEIIKLLTKQYVPANNLFLFNTMTSTTTTLKI